MVLVPVSPPLKKRAIPNKSINAKKGGEIEKRKQYLINKMFDTVLFISGVPKMIASSNECLNNFLLVIKKVGNEC